MTDYYLKDVHSYPSNMVGVTQASNKQAELPLSVTRNDGLHYRVFELTTDYRSEFARDPLTPFELTDRERKDLEEAQDRWVDHNLNPIDLTEEGKLKLSNANLGQVTPGQRLLNDEEASKVAAIKERGGSFLELIESCRRKIPMPDYHRPSIVHFAADPHDHSLQNALDRAEEAIMWTVKYITAGE